MKYTKNKTITPEQKLILIGLLTLAKKYIKNLKDIAEMGRTILIPKDKDSYGHWDECVWDCDASTEIEKVLELEEITVETK